LRYLRGATIDHTGGRFVGGPDSHHLESTGPEIWRVLVLIRRALIPTKLYARARENYTNCRDSQYR